MTCRIYKLDFQEKNLNLDRERISLRATNANLDTFVRIPFSIYGQQPVCHATVH